jgi:hypothetical protein
LPAPAASNDHIEEQQPCGDLRRIGVLGSPLPGLFELVHAVLIVRQHDKLRGIHQMAKDETAGVVHRLRV